MSWWTVRIVANYYGHLSREGFEVPSWLKRMAIEAIKQKYMSTQQKNSKFHPTGMQLGGVWIALLLCSFLSCSEPSVAPPLGCAAFKQGTGVWAKYCIPKAAFLDSLRNKGVQGQWNQVGDCSECK